MKIIVFFISFIIAIACMCICMLYLDMDFFLAYIIAMVCFIALWSLALPIYKKEKRQREEKFNSLFNSLDEQTKETISKARENLENKSILSPEFMDKSNILMILSYDFEQYNLKKCVLKDKKTNTICFFNLLSKEHNNVRFEKPKLSITELFNTNYTYNEERLVYTSATVGFVTTGGFHKEGGDYSSHRSPTGKYGITEFDCVDNDYKKMLILNEVYLNSNLTKKAENSNMRKYIKGNNRLYLLHEMSRATSKTLNYASSAVCGNYSQYGAYISLENLAKNEMALTKAECEEVKNWLLSNMI